MNVQRNQQKVGESDPGGKVKENERYEEMQEKEKH